jgi:hypothetical protein
VWRSRLAECGSAGREVSGHATSLATGATALTALRADCSVARSEAREGEEPGGVTTDSPINRTPGAPSVRSGRDFCTLGYPSAQLGAELRHRNDVVAKHAVIQERLFLVRHVTEKRVEHPIDVPLRKLERYTRSREEPSVERFVLPHVLIRHDFRPRLRPCVNGQKKTAQEKLFSLAVSLHGVPEQPHLPETVLNRRPIVAGWVRVRPSPVHHPSKLGVLLEQFGANLARCHE